MTVKVKLSEVQKRKGRTNQAHVRLASQRESQDELTESELAQFKPAKKL